MQITQRSALDVPLGWVPGLGARRRRTAYAVRPPHAPLWPAVIVALAVAGSACAWVATRRSAGMTADSRAYLIAARAVAGGDGVATVDGNGDPTPLTHLAPLYPIVLALGRDVISWARLLNAGLFATNIALVALLVHRATGSARAAALGAALMLTSCPLLQAHVMIWSESLFICLVLVGVWLLAQYFESGGLAVLALAAAAAGLSAVTRYCGVAFVAAGCAALLLQTQKRAGRRLLEAGLYGLIAGLPLAGWMARNLMLTGNAANRTVGFHPPTPAQLMTGLRSVSEWVVFDFGLTPTVIGFVAVAGLLLWRVVRRVAGERSGDRDRSGVTLVCGAAIASYAAFLLISLTLFDAHTPLDRRILAPLFPVVLIMVLSTGAAVSLRLPSRAARVALVAGVALFVALQAARAAYWVHVAPRKWLGYGCDRWAQSDLVRFAAALPPDALIYSNADDLLYLRTGRLARPIPRRVDPVARATDGRYPHRLDGMRTDMLAHRGYVLYFADCVRDYRISEGRIRTALGLKRGYAGRDGNAWVVSSKTRALELARRARSLAAANERGS